MEKPTPTTLRLLQTLERLLAIPSANLGTALTEACNAIAQALNADKVDAFVHDPTRDSLVAFGASTQPLSALQRRVGLDVLPIANGGRVVHVFQTGVTFRAGRLSQDAEEIRGIRDVLKIESKLGVPLEIGGRIRGVLMIASLQPDFFTDEDARFAEAVARWVAAVAHRAELLDEIERNAVEQGRRAVAEELVTVLAHDLRNFVSPIRARLHVIKRRATNDRREADIRDSDGALRGVERLSRMIADILDVARIDHGVFRFDLQPVDLGAIVTDVARLLSSPEQEVHAACAEEVIVCADPERLTQCLENLVSNAIQHSPRGGAVSVTVSKIVTDHGDLGTVHVVDEGPGIPPEFIARIFERFATCATSTGLGLGLYLARRIAVALGGDLSVESPQGTGARFRLELPIYDEC